MDRARSTLLASAALMCLFAACGQEAGFQETRHSEVAHVADSALRVTTENGAVTVTQAAASTVVEKGPALVVIDAEIRATTAERLAAVRIVAERGADGALAVGVAWPGDRRESNEVCSFTVSLPDASAVTIRTLNGAVRLEGLGGRADVETSNGAVKVSKHAGAVRARSNNGAVEVADATAAVEATTSNGAVKVWLAQENTGPVVIDTSNGSATLVVGAAFQGEIRASTGNGTVEVEGLDSAPKTRGTSTTVVVGTGDSRSRVTTSNGSVTIRCDRC